MPKGCHILTLNKQHDASRHHINRQTYDHFWQCFGVPEIWRADCRMVKKLLSFARQDESLSEWHWVLSLDSCTYPVTQSQIRSWSMLPFHPIYNSTQVNCAVPWRFEVQAPKRALYIDTSTCKPWPVLKLQDGWFVPSLQPQMHHPRRTIFVEVSLMVLRRWMPRSGKGRVKNVVGQQEDDEAMR